MSTPLHMAPKTRPKRLLLPPSAKSNHVVYQQSLTCLSKSIRTPRILAFWARHHKDNSGEPYNFVVEMDMGNGHGELLCLCWEKGQPSKLTME